MKKSFSFLTIAMACLAIFGMKSFVICTEDTMSSKAEEIAFAFDDAEIERISEAFGHMIGRNLDNPGFSFTLESVVQGIRDGASGKESPMTEEEYERTLSLIQENVFNELAGVNLQQANDFLSQNVHDAAVEQIDEGVLQFMVLEQGDGEVVQEHDTPLIHYTGKYLDGTVFGSSMDSGEPISLPLDQTITGFSKGLVGAKEGEKRRLFIHPDMGYGTSGHLPPNSLLIFDVEIVKANALVDEQTALIPIDDDDIEESMEAEVLQ